MRGAGGSGVLKARRRRFVFAVACDGTALHLALARYRPDGTLDSAASGDGKLTTGLTGSTQALAGQGDGKIVVAGTAGSYTSRAIRPPSACSPAIAPIDRST